MKIAINPLATAVILLLAAVPIASAQPGSTPQPRPDIAGRWTLELDGKYGKCIGPIDIGRPGDSSRDRRSAIYAMTCDGDFGPKQQPFDIKGAAEGHYHFTSSGVYPDIFDLQWTQDGQALVGSGTFAHQPLSASLHK